MFSLSQVVDQANDGDFCHYLYSCELSSQDLSLLAIQNDQGYQIKDHTNIFTNGAWPQIYFAPDRYVQFQFNTPNFSTHDSILNSQIIISHQINQPHGLKGVEYDIKLEISKNNGLDWELLSDDLWPPTPNNYHTSEISLPSNYLNAISLNNLLARISIFGDDGYGNLHSSFDMVKLDVNYYNSQTNLPPSNTITSPSQNEYLTDSIAFNASATDDFGIVEYQLNLLNQNNNIIHTCAHNTLAPTTSIFMTCQIDTTNYSNGLYRLQVKSKDNAGKWSSTIISVTFDNISSSTFANSTPTSTTQSTNTNDDTNLQPITEVENLIKSTVGDPLFVSPYLWHPTSQPTLTPTHLPNSQVLGKTTGQKPKTWMLVTSIIISLSYLTYLLSRHHKV